MTASRDTTLLSNPALLEKIDKLRDLNIGQHVPLPQVIRSPTSDMISENSRVNSLS